MEHVAVENSGQSCNRGLWPLGIPVPLSIPCRDAGIEHRIVENEEQFDIVIQAVVISFGNKLGELIPQNHVRSFPLRKLPILSDNLLTLR
jgi:hypothetical protein